MRKREGERPSTTTHGRWLGRHRRVTPSRLAGEVIGPSLRAAAAMGLAMRGAALVPPALAAAVNTAATNAAEAASSSEMAPKHSWVSGSGTWV